MTDLKTLRQQASLTQADLASITGLRQATLSSLENGKSTPHASTIAALATALHADHETILKAINHSPHATGLRSSDAIEQLKQDWPFLQGLDSDLRAGLATSLVCEWTHSSTALEGNTISAGDTFFVLTEGLTVNGKSLSEHQEIYGHAQAIGIMAQWSRARELIRIEHLHQLHRVVQTGAVIDSMAPVGQWKAEPNGTMLLTTQEKTQWHEYAHPRNVPDLIDTWLKLLKKVCSNPLFKKQSEKKEAPSSIQASRHTALMHAYTDIHLGFVSIHPYADGNGRMARLLANIPLLRAGHPPLLINENQRRAYISLLGDYTLARGEVKPDQDLLLPGPQRDALHTFFTAQAKTSQQLVEKFHKRQASRP